MPSVNGAQELNNLCLCHVWGHRSMWCWNSKNLKSLSFWNEMVFEIWNGCLKILLVIVSRGKTKVICYLIASCSLSANCTLRVCDSINNNNSNASFQFRSHGTHTLNPPCPFVGRWHKSWCGHEISCQISVVICAMLTFVYPQLLRNSDSLSVSLGLFRRGAMISKQRCLKNNIHYVFHTFFLILQMICFIKDLFYCNFFFF